MLIAATSDIHWGRRLRLLRKSLKEIKEPDLFLLAGDITNEGKLEGIRAVKDIFKKANYKVYSCLGNEEYSEIHEELLAMEEIRFLKDEVAKLNIKGKEIAIIGTRGSLDRPTYWQSHNVPGIRERYKERVKKIQKMLEETSGFFRVLLTHYAPTYKTLKGEKRKRWPELGCKKLEPVIREEKPELVIHGHSHNGKRKARVGASRVYNVALPVWKKIVEIDTKKLEKGRLTSY